MRVVEAEAEADLVRLLDSVEHGESIVILRGGKRVARLIPDPPGAEDAEKLVQAMEALRRRGPRMTRDEIVSLVREGRDR